MSQGQKKNMGNSNNLVMAKAGPVSNDHNDQKKKRSVTCRLDGYEITISEWFKCFILRQTLQFSYSF